MSDLGDRIWRHRAAIAAAVFVGAAGSLLWGEHRTHMLGAVPYLLLLACPLMHVFMHGGHGHHHGGGDAGKDGGKEAGR